MLKVSAKNSKNQTIQLTQSTDYQLVSITGIDPPVANIATSQLATDDGSDFNIARVPQRNIVLTLQPLGDVETTRTALYPYFTPKSPITLYIQTGNRNVYITGYVESFSCDYNANPQLIQISVINPKPYFLDIESVSQEISISATVNNRGDVELGFTLTREVGGSLSYFSITNNTTGDSLIFNGLELVSGDVITIDTRIGQKNAYYTRGGQTYSLLPYLYLTSRWTSLIAGDNVITLSSGNGTISFTPQYAGL